LISLLERLESGDLSLFSVTPRHAAALPLFREALRERSPAFVKGQVTGPVSFGLAIPREDRRALLYDDTLRDAATRLLATKARWQAGILGSWAPASLPLIMVDEPYLTQVGSAFVSIPADLAFPLLEEVVTGLECLTGLHVCGGTDWTELSQLPFDLLNFDAADHLEAFLAHRESVATFMNEGGMLAWGVVPNDERSLSLSAEDRGRRVLSGARELEAAGAGDLDSILRRSFVSPACGTGSLPVALAERCLGLAAETSAWLRTRLVPQAHDGP
jgi:hypothetical protein